MDWIVLVILEFFDFRIKVIISTYNETCCFFFGPCYKSKLETRILRKVKLFRFEALASLTRERLKKEITV